MARDKPTRLKLLEAAVDLIASDGVQAVTHRSVEERAGVARGSTRYHFHTREELLAAVLEHMADLGMSALQRAADEVDGASLDPGVMDADTQQAAMASMASGFLADPATELARFELFLHAARRPELMETVAQWRQVFVDVSAAHLAARGAPEPEAAARLTIAAMDGLILHALTTPHPDYARLGPAWVAALAELAADFEAPAT